MRGAKQSRERGGGRSNAAGRHQSPVCNIALWRRAQQCRRTTPVAGLRHSIVAASAAMPPPGTSRWPINPALGTRCAEQSNRASVAASAAMPPGDTSRWSTIPALGAQAVWPEAARERGAASPRRSAAPAVDTPRPLTDCFCEIARMHHEFCKERTRECTTVLDRVSDASKAREAPRYEAKKWLRHLVLPARLPCGVEPPLWGLVRFLLHKKCGNVAISANPALPIHFYFK